MQAGPAFYMPKARRNIRLTLCGTFDWLADALQVLSKASGALSRRLEVPTATAFESNRDFDYLEFDHTRWSAQARKHCQTSSPPRATLSEGANYSGTRATFIP